MNVRNHQAALRALGAVALASIVTLGSAPVAQAQFRPNSAYLDAGTVIPVKLDSQLSSKDAHAGDTFTAVVRADNNSTYNLPTDAEIEGVVRSAQPYRDSKNPGTLDLDFRRIRFADGRSVSIQGSLIGLDGKSVETRNGRLVAKPGHTTDRLTYVGYGAGAGLLVSLLTKATLRDTLIGGGLGYLFGSLQKSNGARDVTLKSGTQFGVRLDRRVSLSSYDNGGVSDPNYRNNGNRGGLPGDNNNNRNGGGNNGNRNGLPGNTNINRNGSGNNGGFSSNPNANNGSNDNQGGLPGNYVSDDNGNGNSNRRGGLPTDARQGNNSDGSAFPNDNTRNRRRGGLPFGSRNGGRSGYITVLMNGRTLTLNSAQQPLLRNGEVLLPARAVLNAMNVPFQYSALSRELRTQGENNALRLGLDSNTVTMDDGREVRLNTPAQTINGTLYVPLRFFNLVTGQDASYDANRRVVNLNNNGMARDTRNDNGNTTGGLPPR